MQFDTEAILHAVKESKGEINGRAFSSTTFHLEVDLKDNGAGRSIGRVTRPFKCGDATAFDPWEKLGHSLPLKVKATFEVGAAREDGTSLVLAAIKPIAQVKAPV